MLTEICQELRNWFDRGLPKWVGELSVVDGQLFIDGAVPDLLNGQYYRIIDTMFNDGVHVWGEGALVDEPPIKASIWSMRVPPQVLALADDIAAWQAKYGGVDSVNMSPYTSESFGTYHYSKSVGGSGSSSSTGGGGTWESAFASRLNRWRKI